MKSPGEFALDWANGRSWAEIVADIRAEALAGADDEEEDDGQ